MVFGAVAAVDGTSFSVERGEFFGLLGPNGAGKTTTVETLEGFRRPDAGSVRVLGLDPRAQVARLRPQIGVMLQEGGLYPGLKPLEVLRLFASYYEQPDDPERLLELVGLEGTRRTTVRRLSGGERQRLSLAAALVGRPTLTFLDEPTAGMDPRMRALTWEVVRSLRSTGATVLLTTHAMDEAETLCDRVAIMHRGRLVGLGAPSELRRTAGTARTRFAAESGLDLEGLSTALGLPVGAAVEVAPGSYEVEAEATPQLIATLAGWLAERGVTMGELRASSSLEEIFLELTEAPPPGEAAGGET